MKNNIQTYIQFYLDDVELTISVTDKLKKQEGNFPVKQTYKVIKKLLRRAEKLNIL